MNSKRKHKYVINYVVESNDRSKLFIIATNNGTVISITDIPNDRSVLAFPIDSAGTRFVCRQKCGNGSILFEEYYPISYNKNRVITNPKYAPEIGLLCNNYPIFNKMISFINNLK